MSSPALEAFLARLYTDEAFLADFLAAPEQVAETTGLGPEAIIALCVIDRDSLIMAARSFRAKRAQSGPPAAVGIFGRWLQRARRRSAPNGQSNRVNR